MISDNKVDFPAFGNPTSPTSANNFNSTAEIDDGTCDFTEEKLDYCPDEINEDNENLVDDVCLVPVEENDKADEDEDDGGFLSSMTIIAVISVIGLIAIRRR